MTTPAASSEQPKPDTPHPLDAYIPDPTGRRPLCSAERFSKLLEGMVADNAPRLFAVVQEYGDRVDGRIAAWGMSFDDRAEAVSVDGSSRMGLRTADDALLGYTWGSHIKPRLVWFNREAMTPVDDGDR